MINHEQFSHGLKFLFQTVITGYRLHAMEHYPYAVFTGQEADTMTVEVFEVINPDVERDIHNLELEVGYYLDTVVIHGESVGIYLYEEAGSEPLVKGGDWVQFFGS